MTEKRAFQRYALWFPVTLVTAGLEVWAICRDASAGGMQASSRTPVAVGTQVQARFRVDLSTETTHIVDAEVMRCETNEGELILAFPFRLALRFMNPLPELPEQLADQVGLAK